MFRRKEASKSRSKYSPFIEGLESRQVPTAPGAASSLVAALDALNPTGTPTRHEQRRSSFMARFKGDFTTGPGRFTDQSFQLYLFGGGNSNIFYHGDVQLGYFAFKDISQPATGLATLISKDATNTGNELDLTLVGDTTSVDRQGRYTRFNWTVSDSSGGMFTGATGEGTLRMIYMPGGKFTKRAYGGGTAGAIFQGTVYTTGVSNLLHT